VIDLVLNAVRLALSSDARKSTSALLEFIRRKPEWERDICKIDAHVSKSSREEAMFLSGVCAEKMKSLKYDQPVIEALETSFAELSGNAFEHGCRHPKDVVEISLDITAYYVSLRVNNPKGRRFDLQAKLSQQLESLRMNPGERRGRGLLLVSELADTLEAVEDHCGAKAVFFEDRVALKPSKQEGINILKVLSGIRNPSLERRLKAAALRFKGENLVIDLRMLSWNSYTYRAVLELKDIYDEFGSKLIVWLPVRDTPLVSLPAGLGAESWEEIEARLAQQ
jgi:anti-sigma regulatory factor (Ser/Thr protein kinase)